MQIPRFHKKIAVITGGSRGIGAAIAKRLAQEGCNIVISYTQSKDKALALVDELQKEGVQAVALQADQADAVQIENLAKEVGKLFGHVDIPINNAGIFVGGSIDDPHLDMDSLTKQLAVNVSGVMLTTRAILPLMQDGARIITIGSIGAESAPKAGYADYAASKAALSGYTRGWARDLGPRNITVNLVQPGSIDTDMNPDNTPGAEIRKQRIALGRYGKPEEVASLVAFLASSEASYITGSVLTIDGGCLA